MKTLIVILMLLQSICLAQSTFGLFGIEAELDDDSLNSHVHWLDQVFEIPQIDNSDATVEFRIYGRAIGGSEGFMIQLKNQVNDTWRAELFSYAFNSHDPSYDGTRYPPDSLKDIIPETINLKITNLTLKKGTWQELIEYLLSRQILNMKSHEVIQDSIMQAMNDSIEYAINNKVDGFPFDNYDRRADTFVFDGSGYNVFVKVDTKARSYSYNNPRAYHEIFPEIPEFKYFSEILAKIIDVFEIDRL